MTTIMLNVTGPLKQYNWPQLGSPSCTGLEPPLNARPSVSSHRPGRHLGQSIVCVSWTLQAGLELE